MEYDELTINERQKKESNFSNMLYSMRRGAPTEKILETLRAQVTGTHISQLYSDLYGKTSVCLFPTREQCDRVNEQMLQRLNTEIQQIACTGEIEETESTKSTRMWGKKAAEQLKKVWLMMYSPGSRLSLDCTLMLLKTPLLESVQVASRKLTGLGAVTVVTCITLKYWSFENMSSAKPLLLQVLTALPPNRFALLCLKGLFHHHPRLRLLLVVFKCKAHSYFIVW